MNVRITLLLLVCLLPSGNAHPDDANDRKNLEGAWTFVKPSAEGVQKNSPSSTRVIFRGDSITFQAEDGQRTVQGSYTVDPNKNPKTMDITLDDGGAKVLTLAIYELDGDTLKLCHFLGARAGQQRPKEFAAGKQAVLGILKRAKK